MSELVILDGNAMLHKIFYAAERRQDPAGVEVGAVLGVCSQVMWLLGRMRSRHLVMAFDPGGRLHRHDLADDYKGNRARTDPDLDGQFTRCQEAIEALGITTVKVPGYEADDCIATLVERARGEGMGCWMVGIDKDLFQLVTDDAPAVRLFVLKTRTIIDAAAVRERIGVPPHKAVDYFALVGDASDNVPGVPTVGPTAAAALLQRYDDLEGIYADLHGITALDIRGSGRLPLRLLAGRDQAFAARDLVRLQTDVPLQMPPLQQSAAWTGPTAQADAFFRAMGDISSVIKARRLAP